MVSNGPITIYKVQKNLIMFRLHSRSLCRDVAITCVVNVIFR